MLEFKQSDTAATIILTLTELVTIPAPFFLFSFRNVETSVIVTLIINSTSDLSPYPKRYNQFLINPSVIFAGLPPGQWNYKVYQQTSAINTDTTLTQGLLESGQLLIDRTAPFAYNNYTATTNYAAYDG